MREVTMELRRLIEAYRWQRGLGHDIIATPYGRIVTNLAYPTVWDANHADAVTAEQPAEIAALLASMDDHLAHKPWRVVHTAPFTPSAYFARLALHGYHDQTGVLLLDLRRTSNDAQARDTTPLATKPARGRRG